MIQPDQMWTLERALHVEYTLLSFNQGNFAKFCVAISFALVDPKFLV